MEQLVVLVQQIIIELVLTYLMLEAAVAVAQHTVVVWALVVLLVFQVMVVLVVLMLTLDKVVLQTQTLVMVAVALIVGHSLVQLLMVAMVVLEFVLSNTIQQDYKGEYNGTLRKSFKW
jgi:hypothetical protein